MYEADLKSYAVMYTGMPESGTPDRTTLAVQGGTHRRFRSEKPDELSTDEFVKVLLSRWEGQK